MMYRFRECHKTICFAGGVISALLGAKLIKSQACRKMCVKGLAEGMRLKRDAMEAFRNMKEEADDICYDAKEKNAADEATDDGQ